MQNPFREYFFFTRRERRGLLLLLVALIGLLLVGELYRRQAGQPLAEGKEAEQGPSSAEDRKAFADSIERRKRPTRWEGHRPGSRPQRPVRLTRFDPNRADSATLAELGLPGWMVRNVLRYRSRGGRFRRPTDFRKIYGMTDEQFQQLLPYIDLPPEAPRPAEPPLYRPPARTDSAPMAAPYSTQEKYPAGTVVDLNRADTTELKKIPGIGSAIARMIVTHRQRLGGFYTLAQLHEIHLDTARLRPWLAIDPRAIRRINLNRAGIGQLRSHPYINFYQAKVLVEHRKKRGPLRNLKPFALYEEFSETDLQRIAPYVCFE